MVLVISKVEVAVSAAGVLLIEQKIALPRLCIMRRNKPHLRLFYPLTRPFWT